MTGRGWLIAGGVALFLWFSYPVAKKAVLMVSKSWEAPTIYDPDFMRAEASNGIPSGLLKRLAWQESRYNPRAVSPVGASGLCQFMPGTWQEWGRGKDVFDGPANIDAAGRYLAALKKQTGSWSLALAAYNWGIGNVSRKVIATGAPLASVAPKETRDYVQIVLAPFAGTVS